MCSVIILEPGVLQSGFGVNCLFWPGEFQENCRRISQRILVAILFCNAFGLVFPGFQASPPKSRPKFTPEIVGIPLQFHFLEPNFFMTLRLSDDLGVQPSGASTGG